MTATTYLAVFLAGLLGGGHCMAMCGGIVGALSSQRGARLGSHLAYNLGRVSSYAVAGAIAGALGGFVVARQLLPLQLALYVCANILLLAIGFYLAGWSTVVTWLERPGRALWRRVSPLTRHFLPADTPARALALGLIWGWLPCGLTYGVLALALLSGGPASGAGLMAAFGAGTLPNLLVAGLLLHRLGRWMRAPQLRRVAGLLVLAFGVAGLVHAAWLGDQLRRGVLCLI